MGLRHFLGLFGFSIILLGYMVFLIASFPVDKGGEAPVVKGVFCLGIGEKKDAYEEGTYYHTRLMCKSSLVGHVIAQGGDLYLVVRGINAESLSKNDPSVTTGKNMVTIHITDSFAFRIDPACDQYTFSFDNTKGSSNVTVGFELRELATVSLWRVAELVMLIIVLPAGLALFLLSRGNTLIGLSAPLTLFVFLFWFTRTFLRSPTYTVYKTGTLLIASGIVAWATVTMAKTRGAPTSHAG